MAIIAMLRGSASLVCASVSSLDLRPAATLLQILRRLVLGRIRDLNIVHHLLGAGRLGHSGCRALVLHDFRLSFPVGHASLHAYLKTILSNLGLGQLFPNLRLQDLVFGGCCSLRWRLLFGIGRT